MPRKLSDNIKPLAKNFLLNTIKASILFQLFLVGFNFNNIIENPTKAIQGQVRYQVNLVIDAFDFDGLVSDPTKVFIIYFLFWQRKEFIRMYMILYHGD